MTSTGPDSRRTAAARILIDQRLAAGLSQQQVAQRAGVPQSTISTYENSRRQPTLPVLLRLLAAISPELTLAVEAGPTATEAS